MSLLVMAIGKSLFVIAIAHLFGPSGQGIVALGITVTVTGALFLSVGTDLSNSYLVASDVSRVQVLWRNSTIISAVALVISAGAVELGFLIFGNTMFKDFPSGAKYTLILLIPLQVYHLQIQGLLIGIGDFKSLVKANIAQFLVVVPGTVLLALVGLPAASILGLWALGLVAKVGWCLTSLPSPTHIPDRSARQLLRQQLTFGRQAMVGSLSNLLNFRLDSLFLAYFSDVSSVGLYAAASMIAEGTLYLPKAFGQVVLSLTAREKEPESTRAVVGQLFSATALLAVALLIATQVFLRPILSLLFGQAYLPALTCTRILLIAAFSYGLGLLTMNLLFGMGDPRANSRAGVISALVNASANVVLIPQWGIVGAATASLISYVVYFLLNTLNSRPHVGRWTRVLGLFVPTRSLLESPRETLKHLSRMLRRP